MGDEQLVDNVDTSASFTRDEREIETPSSSKLGGNKVDSTKRRKQSLEKPDDDKWSNKSRKQSLEKYDEDSTEKEKKSFRATHTEILKNNPAYTIDTPINFSVYGGKHFNRKDRDVSFEKSMK